MSEKLSISPDNDNNEDNPMLELAKLAKPGGVPVVQDKTEHTKELTPEEKMECIIEQTDRIDEDNYAGIYNQGYIDNCHEAVRVKQENQKQEKDIIVRASEPLLRMVLGSTDATIDNGVLLSTPKNYTLRASEFDDEKRGTDLIYNVRDNKIKYFSCSVDVTTAKTSDSNKGVKEKFEESTKHPRDGYPTWTSEIVFGDEGGKKGKTKAAPHFIIGLSRDTFKSIAENTQFDDNSQLSGYNRDKDIDFMIASEFFDQVQMQKSYLGNPIDPRTIDRRDVRALEEAKIDAEYRTKLNCLHSAFLKKLRDSLGLPVTVSEEEFNKKYDQKREEMLNKDEVYRQVIVEAQKRKELQKKHKTKRVIYSFSPDD